MNKEEIDWKGGQIHWWVMDRINLELPFKDQWIDLDEDMAQVHYPKGYILDIGWYQGARKKRFQVWVVKGQKYKDWQNPLFRKGCNSPDKVIRLINKGVTFIQRRLRKANK